jgi:hypothetical protein
MAQKQGTLGQCEHYRVLFRERNQAIELARGKS